MDSNPSALQKREFMKTAAGGVALFQTVGLAAGTASANEHSPDAPDIVARNFQGEASAVVGQRVTASVTLNNRGGEAGEVDVAYRIAGQFVAGKDAVRVEPGGSTNLVLSGDVPNVSSGDRTHGIYLDGSLATGNGSITINPSPGDVRVNSITQFASEGEVGDTVSITAQVENRGDTAETERFEFRIGGRQVARTSERTLAPGGVRTITLDGQVPALAAGTYRQGVFVGATDQGVTADFEVVSDPPSFDIETFEAPSRAVGGSPVTARARVRNTGGSRGTVSVQYRIDGTRVATAEAGLDPGATRTLTLEGTVPDRESGIYEQRVSIADTGRGRSLNIRIDEDPAAGFAISRLRAPSRTEVGATVTATADVTNTGDVREQIRIEYRIDGNRIARQEVDLRPGRSVRLTFEGTVPDLRRGSYEQGVFVDRTTRGQTTSLFVAERARVTVSGLIVPESATVGDRVSAYANLRNRGESRATRIAEYRIGNRVVAQREVELDPGERRGVVLEGRVPEIAAGNYIHGVFVEEESSVASLSVRARPAPRAEFVVSEFEGDREGIAGETVSARALVRNTGDASGTVPLEYRIDQRVVTTRRVTLEAGAEQDVSFEGTVPDVSPGDYRHGVFVADTTRGDDARFTVRQGEPRFLVSNVRAPPAGTAGESITVEATVTNTGTAAGETGMQYRFDGDVLGTATVQLERGGETTVTFDVDVPDLAADTYSHGVFVGDTDQGQTTSFVVEPGPTATPTEDDGPGFGPVAGVAGILGGTAYAVKRRLAADGNDAGPPAREAADGTDSTSDVERSEK